MGEGRAKAWDVQAPRATDAPAAAVASAAAAAAAAAAPGAAAVAALQHHMNDQQLKRTKQRLRLRVSGAIPRARADC